MRLGSQGCPCAADFEFQAMRSLRVNLARQKLRLPDGRKNGYFF